MSDFILHRCETCGKPMWVNDPVCSDCWDRVTRHVAALAPYPSSEQYDGAYNHQAGWFPIRDDVRPTACWMEAKS